jgi:hypothetical protein
MSSTDASRVENFRKTINKFFSKLRSWAKEKNNVEQLKLLDSYETKLQLGLKANFRGSVQMFIEGVFPYAHYILEGNDQFFLVNSISTNSEFSKLQDQLKKWWPEFNDRQKNFVRDHVKLLLMLGTLVVKHEELRLIINQYRKPNDPLVF